MSELEDAQLSLQQSARELAQKEFAPSAETVDQTEAYPWDNIEKLRRAGFMGMTIPKEFGGLGKSYHDAVIVIEEMAKCCATIVYGLTRNLVRAIHK